MMRLRLTLALAALLLSQLACARDEGEYLGQQIADAAQQLAASNDDELIFRYTPRSGANQKYWVAVGAAKSALIRPARGPAKAG